jgi:hypothetical protein
VRLPLGAPLLQGWTLFFRARGFRPRLRLHADGTATLFRPRGWGAPLHRSPAADPAPIILPRRDGVFVNITT